MIPLCVRASRKKYKTSECGHLPVVVATTYANGAHEPNDIWQNDGAVRTQTKQKPL